MDTTKAQRFTHDPVKCQGLQPRFNGEWVHWIDYGILEDKFNAQSLSHAQLKAALQLYEAAIEEAEAIFGGEYANHYGPMFAKAFKAKEAARAALQGDKGER